MTAQNFGSLLREFRLKSHNPKTKKHLTQQEVGEYLREEIGIRYSGTAVSDWERNQSKIYVDDRPLLFAIIKILKQYDGIQNVSQANQLLESGNYRILNLEETKILSPKSITEKEQVGGPVPAWAEESVSVVRKFTDSLSAWQFVKIIAWVWIFFITHWLITPSLQFPFVDNEVAIKNMRLYVIGTLCSPLAIGWMTNIKNNLYWKEQSIQKPINLWVYAFQGAYVGFHVGYFFIFFAALMMKQLNLHSALWFDIIKIVFVMIVSYASAQLVPYNLWRAYQRLDLKDGWMFFIFIVVGPAWAWFFLEFYEILFSPIIGAMIILLSITLVIIIEVIKAHKKTPAE